MLLAATVPSFSADGKPPPTEQVQHGLDLFVKSPKGNACATCHEMAGYGTAVGPRLDDDGIDGNTARHRVNHTNDHDERMTMTTYVQSVKAGDRKFPAMVREQGKYATAVWDLSQMPPVLRKFPNTEIKAVERDQTRKHPPASVDYTPQEFADLIGFLRWAANGAAKEVKASEVADLQ